MTFPRSMCQLGRETRGSRSDFRVAAVPVEGPRGSGGERDTPSAELELREYSCAASNLFGYQMRSSRKLVAFLRNARARVLGSSRPFRFQRRLKISGATGVMFS